MSIDARLRSLGGQNHAGGLYGARCVDVWGSMTYTQHAPTIPREPRDAVGIGFCRWDRWR